MRNKLMPLVILTSGGTVWRHPGWLLAGLAAALWPHWLWMARRSMDGSDEPWGLLALATLTLLVWLQRDHIAARIDGRRLMLPAALAVAAAVAHSMLPPIVAAGVAMMAVVAMLCAMLPSWSPRAVLTAMALLSLPLTASLNFYLGYPLRWLCSHGAGGLLQLAGWNATPQGAALLWNGKIILVDAPCAGIAMLWVGLYSAALLSWWFRASTARTMVNLGAAVAIMTAANVLRNAALFFKEAGVVELPAWTHEAIGLASFAIALSLMLQCCKWKRENEDAHA